jgi:hypothetical protein
MFIIINNLAIRVASLTLFRELLIGAKGDRGLTIPNRNIVGDEIRRIYIDARGKLFAKLEAYKATGGKFNLCIDAWTSRSQHAFLGISIHFMDQDFRP